MSNSLANKADKSDTYTKADVDYRDGLKASIASPAFTGNPTAPNQAATDNSTRLATTAFVKGVVSPGNIIGKVTKHPLGFPTGLAQHRICYISINPFSQVHLHLSVRKTNTATYFTNGELIAVVPAGLRPVEENEYPVNMNISGGTVYVGTIIVSTNGEIRLYLHGATSMNIAISDTHYDL